MLLVKTELRNSPIHGLGLFAAEQIREGTIVWRFTPGFDTKLSSEFVQLLSDVAQQHIAHYCAKLKDGTYLLTPDNDRFWNHSENPNCLTDENATETVAIRNIWMGEELTEDYRQYCAVNDPSMELI